MEHDDDQESWLELKSAQCNLILYYFCDLYRLLFSFFPVHVNTFSNNVKLENAISAAYTSALRAGG